MSTLDITWRFAISVNGKAFSFSGPRQAQISDSLNNLKRLPINVVKIDQSFIYNVSLNARDAAVMETIISIAHYLGLQEMAEGVET